MTNSADIGRAILSLVVLAETLFLALVGPALTSDAISGEVERQTWDLLRATPLSGTSILLGKVGAGLGYVLLLIFSALPVMSLAFIFGGTGLTQVLAVQLSVLSAGILYLAIGAFWSSLVRRTGRATVLSYATVGAMVILPWFLPIILQILSQFRSSFDDWYSSPRWMGLTLALSPPAEVFARLNDLGLPWVANGGSFEAFVWWFAPIVFRLLLTVAFLVFAGSRIRGMDWRSVAILLLVLAGAFFWIWGMGLVFDVSTYLGVP